MITGRPACDWTQKDVDERNAAYLEAKGDFIEYNGYAPITPAEYTAVGRRAVELYQYRKTLS